MILTRIKASNVLKYEQLDLVLPENGLIAISGPNESGKSSIGETVCFALFGRTFSIVPDQVEKVVRWGENCCTVTLEFKVGDQAYELSRFLDREGNHSAKLSLLGESETVARGVNQVGDTLVNLLGFEYEQFVESFYLAQREITTPHPHSQAVKIMAGMAPLEEVVVEVESEISERKELLGEVQAECDDIERDIDELAIDTGLLASLEEQRHEVIDQHDQVRVLINEITERLQTYSDNTKKIYKAMSQSSRAKFFRFIFFVLALLSGGVWGLLTQMPESTYTLQLISLLDSKLPQWQQIEMLWLANAAVGFSILFLWMWIRVANKNLAISKLRRSSSELAQSLTHAREIEFEISDDLAIDEKTVVENLEEEGQIVQETEEMPERPSVEAYEKIKEGILSAETTSRKVHEFTEPEITWLAYISELFVVEKAHLDEGIESEKVRIKEEENLQEVFTGMLGKRNEVQARIVLRNQSIELLKGAIDHLSNNFNRDIKDLVGRMLPLFTDKHYEHLQINEDLNVRIFSNEKRDFMDLDEVSSGTQRQIMLALRLALSQKLLSRTVAAQQFTFLDEPFAFFDEERTRKALIALENLGENLSQVWIVAQTFPEESKAQFGSIINCDRSNRRLSIS